MPIRRIAPGLVLIAFASSVLLLSDWRSERNGERPRIAILQYASSALMEESVRGIRDALAEAGWVDGRRAEIRGYNAEGDMPTANAIAAEIVGGGFDLVITTGTPALQAVANANRDGDTTHVFGAVADPAGAGVGIGRDDPLDHPSHLVGIGSFIPVGPVFELARELYPGLSVVGVAWNPAESNSEALTREGRRVCAALGIELLEANVENSAAVREAADSLVARGAEALWLGGDNTVAVAASSLVDAAKGGGIPAFSILSGVARQGALFELGVDFHRIGEQTGALAVQILEGADPASLPVTNQIPERLEVNRAALVGLRDPWRLPEDVLARADAVVD